MFHTRHSVTIAPRVSNFPGSLKRPGSPAENALGLERGRQCNIHTMTITTKCVVLQHTKTASTGRQQEFDVIRLLSTMLSLTVNYNIHKATETQPHLVDCSDARSNSLTNAKHGVRHGPWMREDRGVCHTKRSVTIAPRVSNLPGSLKRPGSPAGNTPGSEKGRKCDTHTMATTTKCVVLQHNKAASTGQQQELRVIQLFTTMFSLTVN